MSGSPREDIDDNNYTLRQRGRMLTMSAPIAASAVKTNRTNTIGLGLKLNPRPDRAILGLTSEQAKEWERGVKAEFRMWAEHKQRCDITGINDFLYDAAVMFLLMAVKRGCVCSAKRR